MLVVLTYSDSTIITPVNNFQHARFFLFKALSRSLSNQAFEGKRANHKRVMENKDEKITELRGERSVMSLIYKG